MSRISIFSLLLGFSLCGCATEPSSDSKAPGALPGLQQGAVEPEEGPNSGVAPLYEEVPVTKKEVGSASTLPPPSPRTRVRMHIDQLQNSIKEVTGGLEWASKNGTNYWKPHYLPLGVPDYVTAVNEVFETTLLYDKLLGDAARDICPILLTKDSALPMAERVFLTEVELSHTLESHPNEIEANLSYLTLRYHGRYMPNGDPKLTPWKTLFSKAHAAAESTETAWTAVCVALLTHPEFSGR